MSRRMSVTQQRLIICADNVYPDGLVGEAAKTDRSPGDTLALFIARELKDVSEGISEWTPALEASVSAIDTAINELSRVRAALMDEISRSR